MLKVANRRLPDHVVMVWLRWCVESISASWDAAHIEEKLSGNLWKIACAFFKKSIASPAAQLVTVAEHLLTEDSFHSRDRSCLLDDNLEAKWRILATSDNLIFASLQYLMIL